MMTQRREVFEGKIDIHDLDDLTMEYSFNKKMPALWIDPRQVTGIDYALVQEDRLRNPEREFPEDLEIDSLIYFPDLELYDCTIKEYIYKHEDKKTLEEVRVYDMPDIIRDSIFITTNLYSLHPTFGFPMSLNLFTKDNISECVNIVMDAYEEADIYAKALLSIMCMWTFDALYCTYDYAVGSKGSIPMEILTPKQQAFMNQMYNDGLRYNNNDGNALDLVRQNRLEEWEREQL